MYSKARFFLILVFLAGAAGFFYLYYYKPKPKTPTPPPKPKTFWEFKYKENESMPLFTCKANRTYSFEVNAAFGWTGIHSLMLNRNYYEFKRNRQGFPEHKFSTIFSQDTVIKLFAYYKGTFWKKGWVKIWQGQKPGFPIVLFLNPNNYNPYILNVKKGQRLDIKKQKYPYYVGRFINGQLISKDLARNIYNDHWFWFSHDCDVMFKATENQFIFVPEIKINTLDLFVNNNRHPSKAVVLKTGENRELPIWLERGNLIGFHQYNNYQNWTSSKAIDVFVGGKRAVKTDRNFHKANNSGWLSLKPKQPVFITSINIKRNKFTLKLKPGQIKNIKVYKGDQIETNSRCQYLVNGQSYDNVYTYTHNVSYDGYLEFKGSVVCGNRSTSVNVEFKKRKGF